MLSFTQMCICLRWVPSRQLIPREIHVYVISHFSHVHLFVTLWMWIIAHQAPLCMGFSRQEYWNRLPCPPRGDFPNPGIEPASLLSPALAGRFFTTVPPGKPSSESIFGLSHDPPMCVPASQPTCIPVKWPMERWTSLPF